MTPAEAHVQIAAGRCYQALFRLWLGTWFSAAGLVEEEGYILYQIDFDVLRTLARALEGA